MYTARKIEFPIFANLWEKQILVDMDFPISEQVAFDLSNIHRGTRDKRVADKIKCIKMLSQNYQKSVIASLLDVDEKTVYNWKEEFLEANNLEGFISGILGNYQGKLDEEKKTSL
jgi:hypothetical protein